ncbi:MAG: PAS domain S-box protein [Chromatiales bacterium]|jgi:PAS domain S-box-containing protein
MAAPAETEIQRYSAPLLRQICDHAAAVVYVKDVAGRYVFVNHRFLTLFGGEESNYVGHADSDIFPPDVAAALAANDRAVLDGGGAMQFEEVVPGSDGEHTYVSVKFPLFDAAGAVEAVCGISTDITQRKRTEDLLRKAALGVSAATGTGVFESIVTCVGETLGADFVFLTKLVDGKHRELHTLAVSHGGKIAPNMVYELQGTPCEKVISGHFHHISDNLRDAYPGDGMIDELGLVAYAGFPLHDSNGSAIGNLAVVSRTPLLDGGFIELVLKIFSVRAAAELERLRADEKRAESEASYRAIFDASEDAIFVLDSSGVIVDANPKACSMYGYTYEEILNVDPAGFSSGEPLYTTQRARQLIKAARHGKTQRFEWRHTSHDGSKHWDEVVLKKATIAGSDRVLAIIRDISERKAQEIALKRSETELRATVEAALDCIVVIDIDGNITEFNPAAEQCFGYRREEVLGKGLAELIIPERYRASHISGMENFKRRGSGPMIGTRAELGARRADGSEFPVELTISVAEGPEGTRFIGYMRDITAREKAEDEREQLEAQLRQAQKMEAIGQLTGGIAHDFNNILTSVMGYMVMAGERAEAHGDAKLAAYLERAQSSGERARDLIQQMLTFSRGHRGAAKPLSLEPLITETIQLMRSTLPSSLELITELDEQAPTCITDPMQLEQVVMNLIINARDAVGRHGRVAIKLRRHEDAAAVCASCRHQVSGQFVEIAVEDNGSGIAEDIQERIFEPFYSSKEVGKGSGMGLAMAHGIIHEYGGHILLDSKPGSGSVFRVLLPVSCAADSGSAASDVEAAAPAPAPLLQGHVAVVDDEPAVAQFMRDRLQSWGLSVTVFNDPEIALRDLCKEDVMLDLAILDYTMPRLSGLDVAQRLLVTHPQLPIVLYTGYAEDLSEQQTRAAGARALLRKPLDMNELHDTLHALLHAPAGTTPDAGR